MEQRTFHRSWVLTAVFAAVILLVAVLMWSPEGGRFAVLIIAVNAAITWRQRLVCSAEGLAVTNWRTQHVPWTQIRGFAPASSFSGGVQILTTTGQVWSPGPDLLVGRSGNARRPGPARAGPALRRGAGRARDVELGDGPRRVQLGAARGSVGRGPARGVVVAGAALLGLDPARVRREVRFGAPGGGRPQPTASRAGARRAPR